MKIAYNPKTAAALTSAPANNDITFDLSGLSIYVRGERFKGTDTTYTVFKKHDSGDSGGYDGLVPVPNYNGNSQTRYLREDGTWQYATDVKQSEATDTDFRPVVLGLTHSATLTELVNPVTGQVYVTSKIYACPSTGILYATKLYSNGKEVLTEHQSLADYVTLNTPQTITGRKTFYSQVNITNGTTNDDGTQYTRPIIYMDSSQYMIYSDTKSHTIIRGSAIRIQTSNGIDTVNILPDTIKTLAKIESDQTIKGTQLISTETTNSPLVVSSSAVVAKLNSDLLDGYHANGLFEKLDNDGNNLSITIGGTKKNLIVNYATQSGKLGYSIKFKNTSYQDVTFDGSKDIDLTGGIYYSLNSDYAKLLKINSTSTSTIATGVGTWTPISRKEYVFRQKWTNSAAGGDTADLAIYLDGNLTANMCLDGYYYSLSGFKKSGSDDNYVLLGGGGHKTISSIITSGYIGTTQVQTSSKAQALSGISSINGRLTINAENDLTRLGFGGVHNVVFGEPGYAHRGYYFRPSYSASGATITEVYIQNASAANSPTWTTTHAFYASGNATHTGSVTAGQFIANNASGPHFTGTSTAGNWAYLRLNNGSTFWDIATRSNSGNGGLWLARLSGTDNGIFVSTGNNVGISTSAPTDKLHVNGGYIKITANSKYLKIGPQNSSYAHYETDASHWFNTRVDINGAIWRYNTNYGISSDGYFYAKGVYANRDGASTYGGISLYSTSDPITEYGIAFRGTGNYGKIGRVQGDWATYFTMDSSHNRGWIFRSGGTNYASVSARGEAYFNAVGTNNYISYPNGGFFSSYGSTGYIIITIPASYKSCTMMRFNVEIYNYSGGTSTTYTIGGYNYEDGNWYNVFAYANRQGTTGYGNLTVRFGHNGTHSIIWIGESNTSYSYPKVRITNVTLGHSTTDYNTWASGWSVTIATIAPTNVSQTVTNPATNYYTQYAGNADTVDGYHASSLWRSDGGTWNPSANISLNASGNGQEWSFDIRRNGYTNCYWHVWDSQLSTMLRVNADNGKVSAPYGFIGNLSGTASSVTINYNNDSNSTYQMLWGSGNYVYGTGGIYCNPYSDQIYSAGFRHVSYNSASYLLRSDGGAAAFNWSGQSGQPTWLWGGNSQHTYYVYNPSNFNVNSAAVLRGNASNPNNSHPGHGAKVFYSWNTGQANNNTSGYSNGITIGSHPNNTAYGFQIVQNMWDDRTYTRRYDGGWQSWKTLAWTSDIPTVTNYYWANVRVSASSSTGTYPTFANMHSTGRVYLDEWIQFSGSSGLYWPNTNSAHLYANTTTSYAGLITQGSRNGYCGLQCGPGTTYMTVMSHVDHQGLFNESRGRWIVYYNRPNDRIGIYDSNTGLGYGVQINQRTGIKINSYPSLHLVRTDSGETSMYFSNNTAGWAIGINAWGIGAGQFAIGQYSGTGSSTWRFRIDNYGYCYTSSYLNLGAGNEKNASNPPYVWGVNGSDNYLRTYATSSLHVGYATNAGNADTLDGVHNGNVTANYHRANGQQTLNLSSLNANTWYPCVMWANPSNSTPIRVTFTDALSGHRPSWSTHSSGFSFQFDFEWIGGGWGTIPWYLRVYRYAASFGGETACYGLEQRNNRSALVLYMRGGTSYYYRTTDGRSFTVYSTTTNIGNSTYPDNVSPRTSKLNDCFLQEASSRFGTCYRATYADNATNADTVDGQHFSYSNSSNSPTYLWATNSNGSSFLAARGSISVNYANSAGSATTASKLSTNAGSSAKPVYFSGGVPVACGYSFRGGSSQPIVIFSGQFYRSGSTWYYDSGRSYNITSSSPSVSISGARMYITLLNTKIVNGIVMQNESSKVSSTTTNDAKGNSEGIFWFSVYANAGNYIYIRPYCQGKDNNDTWLSKSNAWTTFLSRINVTLIGYYNN